MSRGAGFVLIDHPYVNWSSDEWLLPVEQYPDRLSAYRWLHRESPGDRFRLEGPEKHELHNCNGDFGCEYEGRRKKCPKAAMVPCWKAVPA